MKKLLIICGPTAAGKTNLSLSLAKKLNGELLSADSRHVYKGLNMLTGKDIPTEFTFQKSSIEFNGKPLGFYGNSTRLWLTDLVPLSEAFSVSLYAKVGRQVLSDVWSRNKLPIAVGGTGLYLKALTQDLHLISIPPDQAIRQQYKQTSVADLQQALKKRDFKKWEQMNASDRFNPRRLIRALEIRAWQQIHNRPPSVSISFDTLWIGLTAPPAKLKERIGKRVKARLRNGVVDEVTREIPSDLSNNLPAVSSLGLPLLREYISGKKTEKQLLEEWTSDEYQYAKRQMTWFKKNSEIHWFDVAHRGWKEGVEKLILSWYTTDSDIKS